MSRKGRARHDSLRGAARGWALSAWVLAAPALAGEPVPSGPVPPPIPRTTTPPSGSALSLHDALEEALANNPELAMARLEQARARLALVSAVGDLTPTLSAAVYTDAEGTLWWNGGATETLPTGGSLAVSLADPLIGASPGPTPVVRIDQPLLDGILGLQEVRERARDAAEQAIVAREAVEALVLSVSDGYWGLVAARESRTYADQSVSFAEGQRRDTQERFDAGFAGSGDLLQVQRALGVSRQSAVIAASNEADAEARLARLLGRSSPPPGALRLADRPAPPSETPDRDAALATARRLNATWLRAAIARDRARYALTAARVVALPTLDASAAWTGGALQGPEQPGSWVLGLSLSVPLVPVGPIAELRRASLAWEQAELAWAAAEQDLVITVDAAVRAVLRDRQRVELAIETLSAAEAGLEADQSLLRDGRGSSRDVVRSLESLNAAQEDRLGTEIALQASVLELERVKGTLLERMGVEVQ